MCLLLKEEIIYFLSFMSFLIYILSFCPILCHKHKFIFMSKVILFVMFLPCGQIVKATTPNKTIQFPFSDIIRSNSSVLKWQATVLNKTE